MARYFLVVLYHHPHHQYHYHTSNNYVLKNTQSFALDIKFPR